MRPPDKTDEPARWGAAAGSTGKQGGKPNFDTPTLSPDLANLQDVPDLLMGAAKARAARSVRVARHYLLDALFVLDDLGFECEALTDLVDDCSTVLAEWNGRKRVFIDSNIDWVKWRADRAAACHQRDLEWRGRGNG